MCGIAGIVSAGSIMANLQGVLQRVSEAQRHRGPDGEGFWFKERAGFAHRRLAINDLSENGRQPMENEDSSIILVCNGEIYNHKKLRLALERKGHCFRSRSDVEVVLHLYEELGDAFVEKLIGMFAIALWDVQRQRLVLVRDRMGEKPLLYTQIGDHFCFASEMQALLKIPGVTRSINIESCYHFLVYPTLPESLTPLTSVKKLPPASMLIWEGGTFNVKKYWSGKWKPIVDKYVLQGNYLDADIFDSDKIAKFVPDSFDITWKMLCFSLFFEFTFNNAKISRLSSDIAEITS